MIAAREFQMPDMVEVYCIEKLHIALEASH
jgi:hypothetical protein